MAKKGSKVENFDYDTSSGKPLKEYDPSRKGPIRNRSCTDILCCIIFLVFIVALGALGVFAYVWGDPKLLLYPTDSDGNLCGFGDFKSKPKLLFFDLIQCGKVGPGVFVQGCPTPQVCVAECPSKNYVWLEDYNPAGSSNKANVICKDGVDKVSKNLDDLVKDYDCTAYYLNSTAILDRCVPVNDLLRLFQGAVMANGEVIVDNSNNTVTTDGIGVAQKAFKTFLQAKEYAEKIIADIIATWYLIVGALVITMFVSLVWIGLMRWVAGFMVWLAVLLFVGIFAALTAVCFWQYFETKDTGDTYTLHMGFLMTFSKEKFFLVSGIIMGIVFLIIFLILLFLCQRIQIAIQLIKEGSKAIGNMMFTLVWPIFPFIFQLVVVAVWISIAVYLASIGRAQKITSLNITEENGSISNEEQVKEEVKDLFEQIPCDSSQNDSLGDLCGVIKYGSSDYTIYLQIYNLFMGFWLMNFVIGLGQMTLAGAFASYYWAFDKSRDIPTFPILSSFYRCFRYHLGSLAFGSLLIAIVQIIRVALEYLDAKLKGSENPAAKFFLKCLKCCFWCLEKFIRFITKNAYIMVAIYGKNFCVSAKNAFSLILRNVVRVAVVDQVTDFVLFLSRLVIIGLVGTGTYFFFDGKIPYLQNYTPSINFYLVPIIIVIVGCYLITSVFFSVYSMAVDTLFLCFLEDLERNDGSAEKPYFMSKGLMKILGKKNKPVTEPKQD
ncbi:choline transporter-like protein 2 isoform X2 [Littorina saxatilis]|uniref:choline transporter-like protein 2 isoform X2 n=1 Tax=Littorina saxatilis TaxID=31220 RepID=UPI0038B5F5BC